MNPTSRALLAINARLAGLLSPAKAAELDRHLDRPPGYVEACLQATDDSMTLVELLAILGHLDVEPSAFFQGLDWDPDLH